MGTIPNCNCDAKRGLGREVSACLVRKYSLPKAATSTGANRPTVAQQYDSQEVQKLIAEPESILLVDDVVTTGATLIGSANRLAEVYPKARIAAFVALRTVTLSEDFNGIYEPVFGEITLYPSGKTQRPLIRRRVKGTISNGHYTLKRREHAENANREREPCPEG